MRNVHRLTDSGNMLLDLLDEPDSQSIRLGGTILMTPAQWNMVPDNTIQRDTERHARRAQHLRKPHASHMKVSMAQLPDGSRYKIDGHTRDRNWSKGVLPAPTMLAVEVWYCATVEDAENLYRTFDSKEATETTADQMSGAIRKHKADFKSPLLHKANFVSAMRVAHELMYSAKESRHMEVRDILHYWLPELGLLDECHPTPNRFTTGVTGGALLTLRRYGPEAVDFWDKYSKDQGIKDQTGFDAVEALSKKVALAKGNKAIYGAENILILLASCVSAVEAWRSGYIYTQVVKPSKQSTTMAEFAKRAKATKRTW